MTEGFIEAIGANKDNNKNEKMVSAIVNEIAKVVGSSTYAPTNPEEEVNALADDVKTLLLMLGANLDECNVNPIYEDNGKFSNTIDVQLSGDFLRRVFGDRINSNTDFSNAQTKPVQYNQ